MTIPHQGSGTPRPKTISARDSSAQTFRPIFQSGTARPSLVGPLGPFFFFFWGGGGNLLFYSVNVHKIKVQETLLNVILIFRQGYNMSHAMRKSVFGISEHQETSKIHVESIFCTLDKVFLIFHQFQQCLYC